MTYRVITNILMDTGAIQRLVRSLTVGELSPLVDTNPCIGHLVNDLADACATGGGIDNITPIRGLDPLQFPILPLGTTLPEGRAHLALITTLDFLGYGAFSLFSPQCVTDWEDELNARKVQSTSDAGRLITCRYVMNLAIRSGCFGPAYTREKYNELEHTPYGVPPESALDMVKNAYLTMATDALHQIDALVLPHFHFIQSVGEGILPEVEF